MSDWHDAVFAADDKASQRSIRRYPVVYMLLDEDATPLYIGATQDGPQRWQQHRRIQPWWPEVKWIAARGVPDAHERYVHEQRLIRHFKPAHNKAGRY